MISLSVVKMPWASLLALEHLPSSSCRSNNGTALPCSALVMGNVSQLVEERETAVLGTRDPSGGNAVQGTRWNSRGLQSSGCYVSWHLWVYAVFCKGFIGENHSPPSQERWNRESWNCLSWKSCLRSLNPALNHVPNRSCKDIKGNFRTALL